MSFGSSRKPPAPLGIPGQPSSFGLAGASAGASASAGFLSGGQGKAPSLSFGQPSSAPAAASALAAASSPPRPAGFAGSPGGKYLGAGGGVPPLRVGGAGGGHERDPNRHGPLAQVGAFAEAVAARQPPGAGAAEREWVRWLRDVEFGNHGLWRAEEVLDAAGVLRGAAAAMVQDNRERLEEVAAACAAARARGEELAASLRRLHAHHKDLEEAARRLRDKGGPVAHIARASEPRRMDHMRRACARAHEAAARAATAIFGGCVQRWLDTARVPLEIHETQLAQIRAWLAARAQPAAGGGGGRAAAQARDAVAALDLWFPAPPAGRNAQRPYGTFRQRAAHCAPPPLPTGAPLRLAVGAGGGGADADGGVGVGGGGGGSADVKAVRERIKKRNSGGAGRPFPPREEQSAAGGASPRRASADARAAGAAADGEGDEEEWWTDRVRAEIRRCWAVAAVVREYERANSGAVALAAVPPDAIDDALAALEDKFRVRAANPPPPLP